MDWTKTALVRYLRSRSPEYYGKLAELRDCVEDWLGYVAQMFPHYTNHSIKHSDEIVLQLTKILFKDEDAPKTITVPLSPTEVYILIASAYLHDIGMVVSPADQKELLESTEWKSWLSADAKRKKKWDDIQQARDAVKPSDRAVRNLLADIQTKYMIAEYVRRSHHVRASTIMVEHEHLLGRFAFGDPQLLRAISNVCMGHGLDRRSLIDNRLYPTRMDIRGDKVCVRFLALLLRIGDLLDMSVDRARSLLFRAVSPIPGDSIAHWTQYQRILTRMTSSDKIELHAECTTQEEHRFLQDWCEWLVEELKNAEMVMAHSERHRDWKPPTATIGEGHSTIVVERAQGATYRPVKWRLELDHDAVLERLIRDIYADERSFIRELVQNAADANRCQVLSVLQQLGHPLPDDPSHVAPGTLEDFPIHVALEVRQEIRELTGEVEERYVLVVEDNGIGMDIDVIQNYFLQIGRSFYTSEEFRRQYSFMPTSRFGIGFLSVFAVSSKVVVETYKPASHEGPLMLTLNGPKSYLLVDQGGRSKPGTRIEVWLDRPSDAGELTELLSDWCRYVEFPIVVDDCGTVTVIRKECPDDFVREFPEWRGRHYVLRSFPVSTPGKEGYIYIVSRMGSDEIESWDASYSDLRMMVDDVPGIRKVTEPLFCFHGIAIQPGESRFALPDSNAIPRIDIRGNAFTPSLSRSTAMSPYINWWADPGLSDRLTEIVRGHLDTSPRARGEDGWAYKQALVGQFPLDFWREEPGMIRVFRNGGPIFLSLPEFRELQEFDILVRYTGAPSIPDESAAHYVLLISDWETLSYRFKIEMIRGRIVTQEKKLGDVTALRFSNAADGPTRESTPDFVVGRLGRTHAVVSLGLTLVVNHDHPFGEWLVRLRDVSYEGRHGLSWRESDTVNSRVRGYCRGGRPFDDLLQCLESFREIPSLPAELYPPDTGLSKKMFQTLRKPW